MLCDHHLKLNQGQVTDAKVIKSIICTDLIVKEVETVLRSPVLLYVYRAFEETNTVVSKYSNSRQASRSTMISEICIRDILVLHSRECATY